MKPFIFDVPEEVPALSVREDSDGKPKSPAESPWKYFALEPLRRFHMDDECHSITRKFNIYTKENKIIEGYFVILYYSDGYPGRVMIYAGKQGEETHGWLNSLAKAISLLLQYGVSPSIIYEKLMWDEYEPKGITNTAEAPICKSIIDLVLRYMQANFPPTLMENKNSDYSDIITAVAEQED